MDIQALFAPSQPDSGSMPGTSAAGKSSSRDFQQIVQSFDRPERPVPHNQTVSDTPSGPARAAESPWPKAGAVASDQRAAIETAESTAGRGTQSPTPASAGRAHAADVTGMASDRQTGAGAHDVGAAVENDAALEAEAVEVDAAQRTETTAALDTHGAQPASVVAVPSADPVSDLAGAVDAVSPEVADAKAPPGVWGAEDMDAAASDPGHGPASADAVRPARQTGIGADAAGDVDGASPVPPATLDAEGSTVAADPALPLAGDVKVDDGDPDAGDDGVSSRDRRGESADEPALAFDNDADSDKASKHDAQVVPRPARSDAVPDATSAGQAAGRLAGAEVSTDEERVDKAPEEVTGWARPRNADITAARVANAAEETDGGALSDDESDPAQPHAVSVVMEPGTSDDPAVAPAWPPWGQPGRSDGVQTAVVETVTPTAGGGMTDGAASGPQGAETRQETGDLHGSGVQLPSASQLQGETMGEPSMLSARRAGAGEGTPVVGPRDGRESPVPRVDDAVLADDQPMASRSASKLANVADGDKPKGPTPFASAGPSVAPPAGSSAAQSVAPQALVQPMVAAAPGPLAPPQTPSGNHGPLPPLAVSVTGAAGAPTGDAGGNASGQTTHGQGGFDPTVTMAGSSLGGGGGQSASGQDFLSQMAAFRGGRSASAGAVPQQVAVTIRRAVVAGTDRMTLHLKPAELGRVDVSLEFGQDGRLKASIQVEKPQTLELLQRDGRALERALQDAGFKTDSGGLNFSLKGDGNFHREAFGDRSPKPNRYAFGVDDGAEETIDPLPALALGPGRVDLRI